MKSITFPVLEVKMVPTEKVQPNNWNPNSVAPPEFKLLQHSIEEDGFTQPVVCYYDAENDMYIIIDGFHRYRCAKEIFKIPMLPVVVIDRPLKDRIASTIRHNRARGVHGIEPMVNIVANLFQKGWTDAEVAQHLGMDADEVLRLKQSAALPELFKDKEFSPSWE